MQNTRPDEELATSSHSDKERLEREKLEAELEKLKAEPDKLKAERDKLKAERTQLQRPFWQKPGFVAGLLPALIALASLFLAYRTGVFEVQEQRLDLQTREADLQSREARYKLQKETDKLQNLKAQLDHDTNAIREQIEDLKGQVSESERQLDQQQRQNLKELQRVQEVHKRTLDKVLKTQQEEQDKLANRGCEDGLEKLQRLKNPKQRTFRYRDTINDLIEMLKEAGEYHERRKARLQEVLAAADTPPNLARTVEFILFHGTHDEPWKTALFSALEDRIQEESAKPVDEQYHVPEYVRLLSDRRWTTGERVDIALLILKWLKSFQLSDGMRDDLLFRLSSGLRGGQESVSQFVGTHAAEFLDLVTLARHSEQATRQDKYRSRGAFQLLSQVVPQAFLIYAGLFFTDEKQSSSDLRAVFLIRVLSIKQYPLTRSDCPDSADPRYWRQWLKRNEETVKLWTAPELSDLRADPALLSKELRRWMEPEDP